MCNGIGAVAAEQVGADALLFEDVEHSGGAVFDLVFEQEDSLETALVAEEHHAACVFDTGGFVRQHAGYSGDKIGASQCPNLGFSFVGHLRADALPDAVDALGDCVFGRRGGVV